MPACRVPWGAARYAVLFVTASMLVGSLLPASDEGASSMKSQPTDDALRSPPGPRDQSEFMIGTVAVTVVLPESDGSLDSNYETWDSGRVDRVYSEIRTGLDWWESQMPNGHLRFGLYTYGLQPTQYEPILRSSTDRSLWIGEILWNLGFTASDWTQRVRDENANTRSYYGTDWAFTIFVVDSLNDPDGKFTDGRSAFAFFGGPYAVLAYDNGGWGIGNMDRVAAHELGHIFYATDEYQNPGEYGGYLNVREVDDSGCMMDDDSWCLSSGTRGQIGWIDSDGDGLMDPEDVMPTTELTYPRYPGLTSFVVSGVARDVALTNRNPNSVSGNDVSINRILAVEYSTDDGPWLPATASDGTFDGYEEPFHFTVPPLSPGTHTIRTRAVNSVGNAQANPTTVTVVVDRTPPVTRATFSGQTDENGWYLTPARGTLTAQDAGSGVASTRYSIGGSSWILYTEAFEIRGHGVHLVRFYSVDNAGNTEAIQQVEIRIDETPPTVRFTWSPTPPEIGGQVRLDASTSSDNADPSDHLNYTWRITKGSTQVALLYGEAVSWEAQEGTFSVELTVRDRAGNSAQLTKELKPVAPFGWTLVLLLVAGIVLSIAIFLVWNRRRRRHGVRAPPPPPEALPPPPPDPVELVVLEGKATGLDDVPPPPPDSEDGVPPPPWE